MKNVKQNLKILIFLVLVACAHEPSKPLVFDQLSVAQKATFFMEIYSQQYDIFKEECKHEFLDFERTQSLNQKLVLFLELEKLIQTYNYYAGRNLNPPLGLEEKLFFRTERLLRIEDITKETSPYDKVKTPNEVNN